MSKNVYILRESKETGELHLFLANSTEKNECKSQHKSICGQMNIEDKSRTIFSCQPEDRARTQCAKIGRAVCTTCVSHLYMDKI
ncbi:hypothetical protein U8527_11130 [Kordia algicida OT-1]|uniref:Uncharacterized protein n=1 Tax=Kordia algicida OT-1 TaxID=391587 RepID=A9EC21_9FLAO|nr:hypothetical protein [Kordia algicida]EDP94426.1 hypothetical protein KAOT1_04625 [Kordia algicida OT-1]